MCRSAFQLCQLGTWKCRNKIMGSTGVFSCCILLNYGSLVDLCRDSFQPPCRWITGAPSVTMPLLEGSMKHGMKQIRCYTCI